MTLHGAPMASSLWAATRLVQAALICSFACAVATSANAVGKELEELLEMDCDVANFTERVHFPIVDFLEKNRSDLAKLGLPVVLIASVIALDFLTDRWMALEAGCSWHAMDCRWENRLCMWVYHLHALVHIAGVALACGAAPMRISQAVHTAQRKLTTLRSQRPLLHTQ